MYKEISITYYNMENFVSGKKASEILGVHQRTLYQWDKKGLIKVTRTPGGKRLYDVNSFLEENYLKENKDIEVKYINNMKLINFDYIPQNYKEEVVIEFNNILKKYLTKNKNILF